MKRITIIVLFLFLGMHFAFAQGKVVTGTVTSAADGSTIPGVQVIVKGTTVGTTTNLDGKYTLTIPANTDVLQFTFIGMKTTEVEIGNEITINLAMEEDLLFLDEVIVVAYGQAKKGAYTGAAVQINADKIENRPITNITKAIEGQAAGVQVNAGSGQPGSGQSIRIRGFGSFGASNSPLYVLDGVPYSGDINQINPNDVESFTVLKDAASTALYGARAANGVVMITTKKGKSRKGTLSLNISNGLVTRSQKEYDRVDAFEYYPIMWEAYRNAEISGGADMATASQTATNEIADELGYNPFNVPDDQIVDINGNINPNAQLLYPDDLDWEDAIMRNGIRQNYDINYQGATDKTDYYVSLGYLDVQGYVINSDFSRFSGRANVNFQATDWFKTGLNIAATTSTSLQAQATSSKSNSFVNPFRFTRGMGPIYPIHAHDATGAYILDDDGNKIFDLIDNRTGGASSGRHIVAEILWNEEVQEITTIGAKTYAEIKLAKNLLFTTNVSFDQRQYYNAEFRNKIIGDGAPGGTSFRTYSRRTSVNLNQLLNYSKTFDKHSFKALLGHESNKYQYNYFNGEKSEIIADGNSELINFVTTTNLQSYQKDYTGESYFARLNYDYDAKYFLSFSYRQDGSSVFSPESRWGDFWSIGGVWRIDRENFTQQYNWINMLKLRGSYGEVGNDYLYYSGKTTRNYYAYQALYALDKNNQSESGFVQSTLSANDLQWESSKSFDIALEFGLFENLFGTIEFYNRGSSNLLFNVPLPLSSGFTGQPKNIGSLYNRGLEFTISHDVIRTNDLKWNVSANVSTVKNQFTKLPSEEKDYSIINGSKKIMVGHSIYDYWLREWYGVDPEDGAALYRADEFGGSDIRIMGSDTLTTDINNAAYHYAGSAIPDLIGAITNTLTYKDFELSFMFTFRVGGKELDYNYQSIMSAGTYGEAVHKDILDRWQNPGDITNVPRMDASETSNFNGTSSRWLVDASFINLRQLTFTYNIPNEVLNSWGISGARVYASGENLWLINARKGLQTSQSFSGTTSNVYTPSRVVTVGINVKF